jgi:predicted metal-dependent HD superfamily phosphohydrolase
MATRHDAVPANADARVLVDVDLSILGAEPARFGEYEQQVREEYAWVPGFVYRRKRREVLEGFLARTAIFNTRLFVERYEAVARGNLARSIAKL